MDAKSITPFVIVLGCPRSGTSTVARILHTKLNVCMGHTFRESDELNPKGYYENSPMIDMLDGLRRGGVAPSMWRTLLICEHIEGGCDKRLVGVKHPLFSLLAASTLEMLAPYKIIATSRVPEESVINSIKNYTDKRTAGLGFTQDTIEELYLMYTKAIARIEQKHTVYLGPGVTPDIEVERQLREIL